MYVIVYDSADKWDGKGEGEGEGRWRSKRGQREGKR